jgi:hypothetical protein
MITTYIELTLKADNTRHLIPIEAIKRVDEIKKPPGTGLDSKPTEGETYCSILVDNFTMHVGETYNDVKAEINKIALALFKFQLAQNEH